MRKTMRTRALPILLTLMMVFALLPTTAFAADNTEDTAGGNSPITQSGQTQTTDATPVPEPEPAGTEQETDEQPIADGAVIEGDETPADNADDADKASLTDEVIPRAIDVAAWVAAMDVGITPLANSTVTLGKPALRTRLL